MTSLTSLLTNLVAHLGERTANNEGVVCFSLNDVMDVLIVEVYDNHLSMAELSDVNESLSKLDIFSV